MTEMEKSCKEMGNLWKPLKPIQSHERFGVKIELKQRGLTYKNPS